ncbi:MAG: NUDIX domain-containing protein [Burkholderiales bacterium]|jgi:8-oxo-dGTP pyrophosphatase MutT (NUDIX family)|nr:MAG: NUDIX domain-containing protein [Burkholderiales bacterium]
MPIPAFLAAIRQKIGHELVLVPTVVVLVRAPDGRILIVHDLDADTWTLPGGIIEPGETPADAAVREVWEEAGILVKLNRIAGIVGGPGCETSYRNGDKIAWVATVFDATAEDVRTTADGHEIKDAKFVSTGELASIPMRADAKRFLSMAQEPAVGARFEPASWRPPHQPT